MHRFRLRAGVHEDADGNRYHVGDEVWSLSDLSKLFGRDKFEPLPPAPEPVLLPAGEVPGGGERIAPSPGTEPVVRRVQAPWRLTKEWDGLDAFVLGGGSSLRSFDWTLLHDERVVGCNNAFREGPQVCDYVVFCDSKFIFAANGKPRPGFYDELSKFPNPVITTDPRLRNAKEPWLHFIPRKPDGLHTDGLGYNFNTGASALNLALLLGAKTVYLLGFDMMLDKDGRPNYHDHQIDKPRASVYDRMLKSFVKVGRDLATKFPGCSVYNVTDDSRLNVFPKIGCKEFWTKRHEEKDKAKNDA